MSVYSARAAGTVQTRDRIPDKEPLKEQAGFLVRKSLTLPEWEGLFDDFPDCPVKKDVIM